MARYGLGLFVLGVLGSACGGSGPSAPRSKMVHAQDGVLIDGHGQSVRLRSLAFSAPGDGGSSAGNELTEGDYQRAAEMGFSSIRLDFDASELASDADASLFAWLDQQLAWAVAHDLSVIFSMSRASASTPAGCVNDPLWEQAEIQDSLAASWQRIAARYAEEPAVAAFDLLHEPAPSFDLEQWRALGNRLASSIREVDRAHLLVFEQAQTVRCTAVNLWPEESLAMLDDSNVLYAFESRGPSTFTTQSSARSAIVDGGSYPDELAVGTVDWHRMTFETSDFAVAPTLDSDETEWTPKKHYCSVVRPGVVLAQVNLRSADNSGTVYFDNLLIEELGPTFDFVRTVVNADLEDPTSWYLWQDPEGKATGVKGTGKDGERGKASITLTGTTSNANLSNDSPFIFPVKQNYTYRVTGWMKGEHSDVQAASMIGLSQWSYDGQTPLRNAANLSAIAQPFVDWGRAHRVPLFVSAFGASAATFNDDKGGLAWVSDELSVFERGQLGFCYDAYQGEDFGIYPTPGHVNQALVDLFAGRLAGVAPSSP